MTHISTTVLINRPLGDVYSCFMDKDKLDRWLTGFKSVETILGEPLTVGSKHRMVFSERGKEVEMVETVTSIKENEEFAFLLDHDCMSSENRVTFREVGGGTEITSTSSFQGKGLLWRLMMPLLKGSVRRRQQGDFEKLKRLIEGEA